MNCLAEPNPFILRAGVSNRAYHTPVKNLVVSREDLEGQNISYAFCKTNYMSLFFFAFWKTGGGIEVPHLFIEGEEEQKRNVPRLAFGHHLR